MIRRICFYGGPGCGKSTITAQTFAELKMRQYNVELVQEYIKEWTYYDRHPHSFDQVYIFGKQMHKEDIVLRSKVDLIVTDSPIFLTTCYAKKFQTPGWQHLIGLADEFDKHFPPLHVYLERGDKPYKSVGRYQDEAGAREIDQFVKAQLAESGRQYHSCEKLDIDQLVSWLQPTPEPEPKLIDRMADLLGA